MATSPQANTDALTTNTDWIAEYLSAFLSAFGISHWTIDIEMTSASGGESETMPANSVARIFLYPRYFRAKLLVKPTIRADANGYQSLSHEGYHIVTAQLEMAKESLLLLIPPHLHQVAEKIWDDADEQTTERTCLFLTPVLRMWADRQEATALGLATNVPWLGGGAV